MDLFSDSGSSGSSSSSRDGSPEVDIVDSRRSDGGASLGINKEFAARFKHNKQREELQRLQEKHGRRGEEEEDDDEDSSSDDETEDEDGEQITADVDAAILTTLAKIRRKDESIYQAGKRVFDEERNLASQSKLLPRVISSGKNGKAKVTLGEYQRARIQELMKTSDDPAKALAEVTMIERREDGGRRYEDDDDNARPMTHTREQEELRREVTNAFHSSTGDGEDDFFTKRAAEHGEDEEDPESYRKFLLSVMGGENEEKAVRDILRSQTQEAAAGDAPEPARGKAPKVRVEDGTEQENEEFLMNYVLNRGWVDNPQGAPKAKRAPKKEESRQENEEGPDGFSDMDSEDSFDSRAEAFENAYNFRFEEMEGGEAEAQIQSYARNPIGSVRRKEDKRKKEREERAKRKEEEKEEKRKEIDRMRNLKRKAIVDRLKMLQEATGSSNIDLERFQLDDEFDPDAHDRLMQEAFNDGYYGENDDKKPTWDDDIDMGESVPAAKGKKGKAKKAAIEMDADFLEEEEEPVADKKLSKAEKKKQKKREKAKAKKQQQDGEEAEGQVDAEEMDADEIEEMQRLDPSQRKRKMEAVMDEYYGLEYEDMIGDQPTRFKYTQVPKSTFGLTAEEILLADDDDLKEVVSLKRLQPYRDNRKRPSDLNRKLKEFRRKQQLKQAKAEGKAEEEEKSKTKRMGKKERQRRKEAAEKAGQAAVGEEGGEKMIEPEKKKAKVEP